MNPLLAARGSDISSQYSSREQREIANSADGWVTRIGFYFDILIFLDEVWPVHRIGIIG